MKINVLHRILSSVVAVLILLSTTSFTVKKQFCGDSLIDTTIFTELNTCCEPVISIPKAESEIMTPACCKDTTQLLKGQNHIILKSFNKLIYQQQIFLVAYAASYIDLFEHLPENYIPHQYYFPPQMLTDIQLQQQVFLI
ncbi:HYC_CC_PP family protein [Mesonia sp.]|uniref:HYC_CC_PP family protein n=1 Tax=Mesonia sp. TaxID=1960830 RepID=UPI003F98EE86